MTATALLLWGLVAHLVADWILQNAWMAEHKTDLRHPAGYVHAGIHGLALALVFPWPAAVVLAVAHLLIDTRKPLEWWRKFYRQTTEGPAFVPFAMWQDQVAHVVCLALAAAAVGRWPK